MSATLEQPLSVAEAEALVRAGRFEAAAACYARLDAAGGLDVHSLGNYGGVLSHLRRFDAAIEVLARAVALDAGLPAPWTNLGVAFLDCGRLQDAIAAFNRSLRLRPRHAGTLGSLGIALERHGDAARAVTFFDLAIAEGDTGAPLRLNRAMALLAAGRYPEGLAAFEARHETVPPPVPATPLWDGTPLPGRTLLVHHEQGLGDVVQFARFLPTAASASGARVVLCVPRSLVALLARAPGADAVVAREDGVPPHDARIPIMSLARIARATPATIPGTAGLLALHPARAASWAARIGADGGSGPRIGLVWAGARRDWDRTCALMDRRRSLAPAMLAPLLAARADATFYSLQLGAAGADTGGLRLVDHTPEIEDFANTAALIAGLDLVVSVDTSTAHVAASLGKPVWMLSRFDRCWRWRLGERTTPWYPSMRIFAQPAPGDWAPPIAEIARRLAAFTPAP